MKSPAPVPAPAPAVAVTAPTEPITYWTCRACLFTNRTGVLHCAGCGRTASAVARPVPPVVPLPPQVPFLPEGPAPHQFHRRAPVCPSCGGEGDIENMAGRCADCEEKR